jgi:hypothetical protein
VHHLTVQCEPLGDGVFFLQEPAVGIDNPGTKLTA